MRKASLREVPRGTVWALVNTQAYSLDPIKQVSYCTFIRNGFDVMTREKENGGKFSGKKEKTCHGMKKYFFEVLFSCLFQLCRFIFL